MDFTKLKKTIFDELKEIDIIVNEQDKFFPWFIVFDFEAMLEDLDSNMTTTKLKLERIHRPISVSICSNVPEFKEEYGPIFVLYWTAYACRNQFIPPEEPQF